MKKYQFSEAVSFLKTQESFGGLSNMAAGYPINLCGISCRTSEHLYQALKFPDHPEIQSEILAVPSPMGAKMVAKRCRQLIRPDWEEIKLAVMDYCVRAKLQCNFYLFGNLLRSTGNADIVEISPKHDTYWGCVPQGDLLVGHNHLGIQLTNLRDQLVNDEDFHAAKLAPPDGVELRLKGCEVGKLDFGLSDSVEIEKILAVIRANRIKKQANAGKGGF